MTKDNNNDESTLASQFLFARFKHNQDFMSRNPVIQKLLAKKDDWTQEDLEQFRTELSKLNLEASSE